MVRCCTSLSEVSEDVPATVTDQKYHYIVSFDHVDDAIIIHDNFAYFIDFELGDHSPRQWEGLET